MSRLLGLTSQIYGNKAVTDVIYSTCGRQYVGFRTQIGRIFWIRLLIVILSTVYITQYYLYVLCMGVVPELKSK